MSDQTHHEAAAAPDEVPAADSSALAALRARRRKPLEALYIDLVIPRYDPPIYVRYAPITQTRLEEISSKTEKSKERDRTALGNATVLAETCIGLFELDSEGEAVSIDPANPTSSSGDWVKFDDRLVELFELDKAPRAAEVVRQMYLTDGDVAATVVKLGEFSGYSETDLERAFAGN